jgi:hypothetical protein
VADAVVTKRLPSQLTRVAMMVLLRPPPAEFSLI